MGAAVTTPAILSERLANDDLFVANGGVVDIDFFSQRLSCTSAELVEALGILAFRREVTFATVWRCGKCAAVNEISAGHCSICKESRRPEYKEFRQFNRANRDPERDPSAVFLIHGMNTIGAWQESFAWKIQLLYQLSLPVFVFKYGEDRISPFFASTQRRLTNGLYNSLTATIADLKAAGRNARCDVVAHSLGTLLLFRLLSDPRYADISFGRIVLCGSIVPCAFHWQPLIQSGRIEAVLNHRAQQDRWVRLAPWFFPDTGPSGYGGFADAVGTDELISVEYGHSSYFSADSFNTTIRTQWSAFFRGKRFPPAPVPGALGIRTRVPAIFVKNRYWVGRIALSACIAAAFYAFVPVARAAAAYLCHFAQ